MQFWSSRKSGFLEEKERQSDDDHDGEKAATELTHPCRFPLFSFFIYKERGKECHFLPHVCCAQKSIKQLPIHTCTLYLKSCLVLKEEASI